jgi:O-antigen ligase/Tfp pilus assembly protein PilF
VFVAAQFLFVAKLALVILAFDPFAADTFTLVKSTLSHAAAFILAALLAALFVRHGAALLTRSWIHLGALVVVLCFGIASLFALDATVALFGASRRFLGLTQMLDNTVLYLAGVALLPTRTDLRRLFSASAALAALVAAYGVIQHYGHDFVSYERPTVRPISTLGQPDILAGLMSIAFTTTCAVLALAWPRLRVFERSMLMVLAVAELAVVQFTEVRNALLGLPAGLAALGIVWVARRKVAWRSRQVGVGALGVVVVLMLIALPLSTRLGPDALSRDSSVLARLEAWKTAARLVAARPAFGLGPDNFVVAYRPARTEEGVILSRQEPFDSTHNWLLYAATSAGVIGALAMCGFLGLVFADGVRAARSGSPHAMLLVPVAAYLGQGLVNVNDVSLDWVVWVAAGGIAAAAPRIAGGRPRVEKSIALSLGAAAVLGLVAAVFAAGSLARIGASEQFKAAIAAAQEGKGVAAIDHARAAISVDPRRAEYWNAFGDGLAVLGNASAAATAFADAAARAPWDPGYPRNIALQKVRLGDVAGATAAIERSLSLDPFDPDSLDIAARFTFNRGDYAGAAQLGERAIRIGPEEASRFEVPVRAYLQLKRYDDAARVASVGLAANDVPHLRYLLALVYFTAGRFADSQHELDRALALDPASQEALQLRGRLRAAQ